MNVGSASKQNWSKFDFFRPFLRPCFEVTPINNGNVPESTPCKLTKTQPETKTVTKMVYNRPHLVLLAIRKGTGDEMVLNR